MVKVGIVGAGRISKRHEDALSELKSLGLVELTSSCDPNLERINGSQAINKFHSIREMFREGPELDLVSVLTESGNHFAHAMELLGYKVPVLIEKPLTLNFDDAKKLVESFEEKAVPLFVVKQNRLNPAVQELMNDLKSGKLGEINFAMANVLWSRNKEYYFGDKWRLSRKLDGGVIWNQASHYVDLMVQILGPIEKVQAFGANYLSPAETEDTVFVNLVSRSGLLGSINATTAVRPVNFEGSLLVSGNLGVGKVSGHALNLYSANNPRDLSFEELNTSATDVYGQSHSGVYISVVQDLSGGPESEFRAKKTLEVVRLMEAIEKSVLEERIVHLDEIFPLEG